MATSPNFNWPEPDNTDLVKNGALAIRTAVNAIDTSLVDLKGGTTGQVLAKASGTDMDFSWVAQDDSNAIQNAIVDAKGDLIAASAADTPARLAVGTNGQVLTADSTAATGLAWAAPAGGGKVLQVVQGDYATSTSSSSSTYADTGLTATITPTSATSKILVMYSISFRKNTANQENACNLRLFRGATNISQRTSMGYTGTAIQNYGYVASNVLDTPATTSATTYKVQFASDNNTAAVTVHGSNDLSTIILMEIGA